VRLPWLLIILAHFFFLHNSLSLDTR
jgi:hypothetical protein